jgi:hypothetical protein
MLWKLLRSLHSVQDIENVYNNFLNNGVAIHPNGPWN